MSNVFVGQLLPVAFNFAPRGFALAAGQLLPISQNTALFSLFGTMYGGNGVSNFALPNLQGNVAISYGQGPGLSVYDQGQVGGTQNVTVLQTEMPMHNHFIKVDNTPGNALSPANNSLAQGAGISSYLPKNANLDQQLSPNAVTIAGASLPHNNMMPFLTINWVVALQGVFPPRS